MTDTVPVGSSGGNRRGRLVLLIGLLVQAATTYLMLIVAARALDVVRFGALSGLYLLLTSLATGLFLPLEQEITRRSAADRSLGLGDHALQRRALAHGSAIAVTSAAVALLVFPAVAGAMGGRAALVWLLCVSLPIYAAWFVLRGQLAGAGRLGRYGAQLSIDGGFRLIAAIVLVAAGAASTVSLGALFVVSPLVAIAVTALVPRHEPPLPAVPRQQAFARPLYLLLASGIASQVLMNGGPVVVGLLATRAERAQVGVFLAILVVVRIPVVLFNAVQPSVLPVLAAKVTRGDVAGFVRTLGEVMAALVAVVAVSCAVVTLAGPSVISAVFSFQVRLPTSIYLELTLAVGLFLIASLQGQALVSLKEHRWVSLGWACGVVGLVVGTVVGQGAIARTSHGLLAGGAVAVVVLGLFVIASAGRLRSQQERDAIASR